MSKKQIAIVFFLSLFLTFNAFSQRKADQNSEAAAVSNDVQLSWNDRLVMHALRSIHSAEMAFQMTYGAGNFGTLQQLNTAELIDPILATGEKYGYNFSVVAFPASSVTPPTFEVRATPRIRRARYLSFYLNETCEIRGADKQGREAGAGDPVIEPCGASPRSENERLSMQSMRSIHSAQATYQATVGAGLFGSFEQLFQANLAVNGFALVRIYRGYSATMTTVPPTATMPARFVLKIVPTEYGRTGIRSFYIDETGVLRGADKHGLPADENDPPVEN